jgi:hypothetical protein
MFFSSFLLIHIHAKLLRFPPINNSQLRILHPELQIKNAVGRRGFLFFFSFSPLAHTTTTFILSRSQKLLFFFLRYIRKHIITIHFHSHDPFQFLFSLKKNSPSRHCGGKKKLQNNTTRNLLFFPLFTFPTTTLTNSVLPFSFSFICLSFSSSS